MKNLVFVLGIVFSSFVSIAQPTQCVADALQTIEDQGGLLVGTSYEWIASGDDHIQIFGGTDGAYNTETYKNGNLIDPSALEGLLVAGDLIRIDGVSIGLDDASSFSASLGYLCPDWGVGITNDLAVVITLPVVWLEPTVAEIKYGKVDITFSTAQQINNSHFEVEHSRNGRQYRSIGKVEGEGNCNKEIDYEFIHDSPSFGINYYRVKQIDLDGQYSFSNVASVMYRTDEVNVYPNPVKDLLIVSLPSEGSILIYNHFGQQIGKYELAEGENTVDLTAMDSGLYLLQFFDGSVRRVVKN